MTQQHKQRVRFSHAMSVNREEVYLDQHFPNLSDKAEDYMVDVIQEFEDRAERAATKYADDQVDSRLGREGGQFHNIKSTAFWGYVSNEKVVKENVNAILQERIKAGERIPEGISPEIDAQIAQAEQERADKHMSDQEQKRTNALVKEYIDGRINERLAQLQRDEPHKNHTYSSVKGDMRKANELPNKEAGNDTELGRAKWYREEIEGPKQEQGHEPQQEKAQQPAMEMV